MWNFCYMDYFSYINEIIKAGKKHNITAGFHSVNSDPTEALKYKKKGFKIIALSVDSIFLSDKASESLMKLKK